jgi:hypothetical protein
LYHFTELLGIFCFAFIYAFSKLTVRRGRGCGYVSRLELTEALEKRERIWRQKKWRGIILKCVLKNVVEVVAFILNWLRI